MFKRGVLSVMGSLLFLALVMGCVSKAPIAVGFVAELTGKRGQLGVDARDGAQLAVDRINEQGGIGGRSIQLLVRDDKGNPDTAR
jgi:branched-chain amino acid transport system substrate-binding protein